jgi:hypothetical protein
MATQRVDVLGAEARSVEEGLRARHIGDGTFTVRSVSRPGLRWTVRVEAVKQGGRWMLRGRCGCESGQVRTADLVPCQHSACVLRSLERRGLAKWVGGVWEPSESLVGAA